MAYNELGHLEIIKGIIYTVLTYKSCCNNPPSKGDLMDLKGRKNKKGGILDCREKIRNKKGPQYDPCGIPVSLIL